MCGSVYPTDSPSDKVARLKAQIDAGAYHVSGDDIADSMIRKLTEKTRCWLDGYEPKGEESPMA